MAFQQWSKTADNNATADPTVNWAEGQPPPTINNSARAMMARLAEWRDDMSFVGSTGGSSTAYTLTTAQGVPNPPLAGTLVAFIAHATSGLNPTLSVDSGTPYPICSAGGVFAGPGTLRAGVLYTATCVAGSAWLIHQAQSSFSVPIGGLMDYTSATLPAGGNFIFPYGQAISRSIYSEYYGLVGTTYGGGDGTTTFNVPNLKGRLTAALDNLGDGVSAGILNTIGGGVTLGAVGGSQTHTIALTNLPNYTLTGPAVAVAVSGTTAAENTAHAHGISLATGGAGTHNHFTLNSNSNGSGATVDIDGGNTPQWQTNFGSDPTYTMRSSGGPANIGLTSTVGDHAHTVNGATGAESAVHGHAFSAGGATAGLAVNSGGSGTPLNDLPTIMTLTKILRII